MRSSASAARAATGGLDVPDVHGVEGAAENSEAGANAHSANIIRSRGRGLQPRRPARWRRRVSRARRGDFAPHRFEQRVEALAGGRRHSGRAECRARANTPAAAPRRSGSSSASILLAATSCGLSASRSPAASRPGNSSSSRRITSIILDRFARGHRRHVDQMHEHLGPLEMAQEPVARARALRARPRSGRARRRRRTNGRREPDDAEVRAPAW